MSDQTVDVLAALKALVQDDALVVTANNLLAGDPSIGIFKALRVNYTVGGVPFVQTVAEGQTVSIPGAGETPGPLVLVSAVYGVLPAHTPAPDTPPFLPMLPAVPKTQVFEMDLGPGVIEQAAVTLYEEGACWPNVMLTLSPEGKFQGTLPDPVPRFAAGVGGGVVTGLRDGQQFTAYYSLTIVDDDLGGGDTN